MSTSGVCARINRRRELEAMLRPIGGTCSEHLDRAVALALAHDWNVQRDDQFSAQHATRTISARPLASDQDFAAFVHEGGHLEDPQFRTRRRSSKNATAGTIVSIEAEAYAWTWAIRAIAYRWNLPMHSFMTECLRGYYVNYHDTIEDLRLLDQVLAYGVEQGRRVVRLRPAAPSPLLAHLGLN